MRMAHNPQPEFSQARMTIRTVTEGSVKLAFRSGNRDCASSCREYRRARRAPHRSYSMRPLPRGSSRWRSFRQMGKRWAHDRRASATASVSMYWRNRAILPSFTVQTCA